MSISFLKKIFVSHRIELVFIFLFIFFALATIANAQGGFVPLEPLPGVVKADDPGAFLNSIFRLGVVLAGFLAVAMIAVGGFQYMTTEAISGKGEAKERITSALSGLFLILLSSLLLTVINPDILNFNLFKTPAPQKSNETTPSQPIPNTGNNPGNPLAQPPNFCYDSGEPSALYRTQEECLTAANRAVQNRNAEIRDIERKIELLEEERTRLVREEGEATQCDLTNRWYTRPGGTVVQGPFEGTSGLTAFQVCQNARASYYVRLLQAMPPQIASLKSTKPSPLNAPSCNQC